MRNFFFLSILFLLLLNPVFGQIEVIPSIITYQEPEVVFNEHYENRVGAENPDSSTSIAGWVGGNAATFQSSTEQARSGTTSIKIVSGDGTSQFKYFDFSSASNADLPDVENGDEITLTGWIYAPSGATVRVWVTSTNMSITNPPFTPDTWTQFTYTMTASGSGNFYIYTNATTYTYVDDIRIYSPQ